MSKTEGKPRYKILSLSERHTIWVLRNSKYGIREIARMINRNPSTISREIKRGTIKQWINHDYGYRYDYEYANKDARFKLSGRGRYTKLNKDHRTAEVLTKLIKGGYSPYAAIEIAKQNSLLRTKITSRTVYNYIHSGVLDIPESCLVIGFKKIKKKEKFEKRANLHTLKAEHVSIEKRPISVLSRLEFGHWEGDTVVGPKNSKRVLFTLCERKTRYLIAILLEDRKQTSIAYGLDLLERSLGNERFNKLFKSLTLDNGREFLDVSKLQRSVFTEKRNSNNKGGRLNHIYFTHPYCSSERGSNENVHRFLRRRFPKKIGFDRTNNDEINGCVKWINTYPRLLLNGHCSQDLFARELQKIS